MIAEGIRSFYRSAINQRLHTALNVLGMATGIAVFLILMLVVRYEYSYNGWISDAEKICRLDQIFSLPGEPPFEVSDSTFMARDMLLADYPEIQAATRIVQRTEPVSRGSVIDQEVVDYVDPEFLDVINLPLVAGSPAQALSRPASIVITESVARKYFQTSQAVGMQLQVSDSGVRRSYTVGAVARDVPSNSTIPIHILVPLTPSFEDSIESLKQWGTVWSVTYLRFHSRRDAKLVAADLRRFVSRRATGAGAHPERTIAFSLVGLADAHFHDFNIDADVPGIDRHVVLTLALVGLLAVLTAAINTINLATACAGMRAREIALRKVLGATRLMLMVQFLAESVALVGAAGLIGLALAELAVPMVDAFAGWSIHIAYPVVVPALALLVLVVGLGAGLYPAVLLASYQPASVLSASRTQAGGRMGARLRGMLVLVQFAGAITFVVCTLVVEAQGRFLRNTDRGFERHGMVIIDSLNAPELDHRQAVILDALRRVPGVTSATLSPDAPGGGKVDMVGVTRPGLVGQAQSVALEYVGRDYFETYRTRLLAGRQFDDRRDHDDIAGRKLQSQIFGAILNRTALSRLGFADPAASLGQSLSVLSAQGGIALSVIGVVDDVRFSSPRDPVTPKIYVHDSHSISGGVGAVRFQGFPEAAMMRSLQSAWHDVAPDNPFVAKTVDERTADFYRPDQQRARLFSAGAVLAVAIASVGLYGLASFSTARRTREIGIRKVLGASTATVLALLVGQTVRPVLIANLVAWPLAWVAMRSWLAGFDQRIVLSPLYFIIATAGALAISVLTVAGQAWRVARAEPARALRHE